MHVVAWKTGEASNGTIMLDDESSSIGSVNVSVGRVGRGSRGKEAARQRPSSNWP